MTVADVLPTPPSTARSSACAACAVPPDRWYGDAPPVLYAHPWQAERLRDALPVARPTPARPARCAR